MNFKEMIESDLDIFINLGEFAENINISGKSYPAIITNQPESSKQAYEGMLIGTDVVISLKYDEELYKKYRAGRTISINNIIYIIHNIELRDGLLTFYLIKNEGG